MENFISSKLAFVVDDGKDDSKRKRKLERIPICTEKRRKLFIQDYLCDKGPNWDHARTMHRSIFAPLKIDIPDEELVAINDIYIRFKTDDDHKESADVLAVLVPGPLPNTVQNKCAEQVFKGMKMHKFQAPKLGRIELSQTDLLSRLKAKSSFQGASENYLVFSSEKKLMVPRMRMEVLDGDTFFNRWPTRLIPFSRLCRVDKHTYSAIFAGEEEADSADPTSLDDMRTADEATLTDDQRIPFPHEHDSALCQQMIKVRVT